MPSQVSILYWKEIPIQVKAEDLERYVSVPLESRFQEAADAIAMMDGSYGNDDYLDAWQWGDPKPSDLFPDEAAQSVADSINKGMPQDFVARIRDLHNDGRRFERPGAIDHWIE